MITRILHTAYDLPLAVEPRPAPAGAICALSGDPIGDEGALPRDFILTSATSAPHEQYRAPAEPLISAYAASCYQASARSGYGLCGNLLAYDGRGLRPMVSAESAAAAGRPTWQGLIYGTTPGLDSSPAVAVFSDESKRRLWLSARVSTPGSHWMPYLSWASPLGMISRTLSVDLGYLRSVLGLCEYAYALGFPKPALVRGLFQSGYETLSSIGMARARALDAAMAPHRGADELLLAAFVVQRIPTGAEAPEEHQCLIPTFSAPPSTPQPAKSKAPSAPTLFD